MVSSSQTVGGSNSRRAGNGSGGCGQSLGPPLISNHGHDIMGVRRCSWEDKSCAAPVLATGSAGRFEYNDRTRRT